MFVQNQRSLTHLTKIDPANITSKERIIAELRERERERERCTISEGENTILVFKATEVWTTSSKIINIILILFSTLEVMECVSTKSFHICCNLKDLAMLYFTIRVNIHEANVTAILWSWQICTVTSLIHIIRNHFHVTGWYL